MAGLLSLFLALTRKNNDDGGARRERDSAKIRIDALDVKVIKELFSDPGITTTDIAKKLHQSLSTIQRRRVRLEKGLIKRSYSIDIRKLGWRLADLSISVEKGQAKKTARELVSSRRSNVIVASLRIGDPMVDIMANIFYKDSQELHELIESVKATPYVTRVEWSEVIEVLENNLPFMLDRVLSI